MLLLITMNSTALMLLLGLMGTVWSRPLAVCDPGIMHQCREGCKPTPGGHIPDFKHVSELQDSSVAPWDLISDSKANREPEVIDMAQCKSCTVQGMKEETIYLEVSVYEKIHNGTCFAWCKCPFQLAVGCTCVKEQ